MARARQGKSYTSQKGDEGSQCWAEALPVREDDFGGKSDSDDLPSVDQLRLRNNRKRARAQPPTVDSPGPSTRRRRLTVHAAASSSSAPALGPALQSGSSASSSRPVPKWPIAWRDDNFLSQLRKVYEEDPDSFYNHINRHYLDYEDLKKQYRFNDYAEWITTKSGETQCFTGIFHAIPNASITLCIQAATPAKRHDRAKIWYMTYTLSLNAFRTNNRPHRKTLLVTERQSLPEFQDSLTGYTATSHICNWAICINPIHVASEQKSANRERNKYFQYARENTNKGYPIARHCNIYTPPCLL
ncbi:hypothetical protein Neosp_004132 [[Neocosmospora] mangrovei]